MKYQTEKTPTKAVGMQDARNFHYQFNATMFKTLSEAYSDPIRAVIRELACNSSDAHVMAKTETKAFELHLPTTHEPEFTIRDFGTGMDDQEINDLFTMYGGSNKRNNNEVIGALGIGSKSPYAVTTLYNVVSTKDGITRTYTATVEDKDGEGDMPVLLPGTVTKTPNAPNGVTVSFAVPENRIWEYENKAKIALEFFASETYKINIRNFTPHKQSYVLKTDTWGLRREARTAAHGHTCRAIMGKVQYAIPTIDESRTNSIQKKILEMPLDLFFPLGSLSFAPSRETLKMNDKTTAAVLAVVDKVFEESLQTVKDKINACTDVWQAQILLFSLLNETKNSYGDGTGMSGLIREALDKGKLYGQYKNFTLSESKAIINMLKYSHISVTEFDHNSGGRRGRTSTRSKKNPIIASNPKTLREDKKLAKVTGDPLVIARNRFEITVKPDVMFCINDTDKPGDKYVHYHIQEVNKATTVYMIHRNATDADMKQVVKNAKALIADIGNAPVVMLSQLVTDYATVFAARRTSGSRGKSYQISVLKAEQPSKIRRTQNGWVKAWRAATDEEMDAETKYYVVTEKRVPTNIPFSNVWDLEEFLTYVRHSGKFGIDGKTPIYAVRKGSKVLKNEGWVELFDHIYTRVNEIMTPTKTLALSLHMTPFNDDCSELLSHLAAKQPLTNSPAQMFACALAEAKGVRFDNWSSFKYVLTFCEGRGKYTPGLVVDFNEKWAAVKAGYPMLQFVGGYSVRSNIKTLVDYIRQVDEQNFREAALAVAASN